MPAPAQSSFPHVVFMGVAGCGKSSLAAAVAKRLNMTLIEGDDFHSASNRQKMNRGIALTDADRAGWLDALGDQLHQAPQAAVLTCSALKASYRDRLRRAAPGLRFVFMDLSREQALVRVKSRPAHFFNPSLIDSQFATLQSPEDEVGVLKVNACDAPAVLCEQVVAWLVANNAKSE